MELPAIWFQHQVTAQPYAGTDGRGRPTYGTAVMVDCFKVDHRRYVRGETGEEVLSEATIYTRLDAQGFNPKGKVTLPDGRVAIVITVKTYDGGNLPLPECLEVILT